jgi:hypothetical protein
MRDDSAIASTVRRMSERGLVVSEFIRRFREDKPTPESSRRVKRSDFWWLKDEQQTGAGSEVTSETVTAAPTTSDFPDQRESLLSIQLSSIGSFTPTTHSPQPADLVRSVESVGAELPTEDACEEAYSRCHEILKQIRLPVPSSALAGSESPLDASWFSAGPVSLGDSYSSAQNLERDDELRSVVSARYEDDGVLQESYSMDAGSAAWESFLREGERDVRHDPPPSVPTPLVPHPFTSARTDPAAGGLRDGESDEDAESSVLFISPSSSVQSGDFLAQVRSAVSETDRPGVDAGAYVPGQVVQPPATSSAVAVPDAGGTAQRVESPEHDGASVQQAEPVRWAETGSDTSSPAVRVDEELVRPFLHDEALQELWDRLRGVRGKAAALRAVLAAR